MDSTVAVIGATGFVGRRLVERLREGGRNVLAIGSRSAAASRPGLECRRWDATRDSLEFPRGVDAVYYLAQSPHYRDFATRAEHVLGVNVLGAVRAARAAEQSGARFFFYASTGSVYAPSFDPRDESSPTSRASGYPLSKLAAEESLALLESPIPVVCGRVFGAFGPGQTRMLVANVAERVRTGMPVTLAPPSPGSVDDGLRVSLSYVDDLVACLVALGERATEGESLPHVLNLAGPEAIDLRRLATAIGRELGRSPRFAIADQPRAGDLIADVSALRSLVDVRFTPFEEAIARTLREPALKSA